VNAFAFWKTAHVVSAAVVFGTGLGICWLMVAKPLLVAGG